MAKYTYLPTYIFIFPLQKSNVDLSLFSKRVEILKTEYKYGQYCTPLSQSDCRYFFVLAIIMNIFNIINCNRIIFYTKIINITSKSIFFILSPEQSSGMFPRHIRPTKISDSFALNLSISVPLTIK